MKWLRLLIISNPLRGGYKVNITQSEHQTITVSQPSFNNQTAGFTIEDYPTIDISLKADPGYTAGVLNHTSFTFSNDVREVDIFATDASVPDITYNGDMNVFLAAQASSGNAFCISNKSPVSDIGKTDTLIQNSEFAIIYNISIDPISNAGINNTNNFYNLLPNTTYKISNLKIEDTTLTDDELSTTDYENKITSNTIKIINETEWFDKVYLQCTGVDLKTKIVERASKSVPSNLVSYHSKYRTANLGGFIFDYSFKEKDTTLAGTTFSFLYYKQNDYSNFTENMQEQIEANIDLLLKNFFKRTFTTAGTDVGFIYNLNDSSVLEEYLTAIKTLQTKFKDNQDALGILSKYTNIAIVKNDFSLYKAFSIDKDNVCGLVDVLSCGLPQIYYCMLILMFVDIIGYQVDDPIISTIPVSITFTKVEQ